MSPLRDRDIGPGPSQDRAGRDCEHGAETVPPPTPRTRVGHGGQGQHEIGRNRLWANGHRRRRLVGQGMDQRRYRHGHGTRFGYQDGVEYLHDHQQCRARTASTRSPACQPTTRPTSRLCRGPAASPCSMLPDEVVVTALVGLLTSAVTAIGLAALGARLTDGLGPAIGMTQVCTARALLAAAYGRSRLHLLGGRQGQPDELKPTGSTRSRHRLADPAVHGTWSPARHLVARTA